MEENEPEQYDFPALMTAVADLYSQDGVLEMQIRHSDSVGKHIGRGAVSGVSTVFAAVTRPSTVVSHQVKQRKHVVVLKKSAVRLFSPTGGQGNADAIRSFIMEIRLLSHKPLREHPGIITLLGVHWDLESVSPNPNGVSSGQEHWGLTQPTLTSDRGLPRASPPSRKSQLEPGKLPDKARTLATVILAPSLTCKRLY